MTEPDFWGKNDVTNGQKGPKTRFFGLYLWSFNILRKLHAWEKSGSQVTAKNGSRPMRFQYSLIVNTSLIDRYLTLIFGMYMGINDRNKVYQQAF